MGKSVLIPVDFSAAALNAIKYALKLYSHIPCEFYLLNAFQISGYSVDSPLQPDPGDYAFKSAKDESERGLEHLMETVNEEILNVAHKFETIATHNSLLHAIKTCIAEKDIDLIVMGTKGITGAESLIFGTNAINIMEGVRTCPVMTIPMEHGHEPPREIVFPTDYKTMYRRKELNYLLEIASIYKAPIRVLHIQKGKTLDRDQKSKQEILASILKEHEYSFHQLADKKVHKGIGAFVNSRESNMIAFINRKHSLLGNLLSKPLVKELGYHYKIPILALNEP